MDFKGIIILFAVLLAAEGHVKLLRQSKDGKNLELEVELPHGHGTAKLQLQKSTKFEKLPITVSNKKILRSFSSHLLKDDNHARFNSLEHQAVVSTQSVNGKMEYEGHFSHKGNHYQLAPLGDGNHEVKWDIQPPRPPVPPKRPGDKKIETFKHPRIESLRATIEKKRVKRQTNTSPTTYVVEVYLLLDHKVWEHFLNMNSGDANLALEKLYKYYTHILDGVDVAYRSIGDPSLSISCTGIFIAKTPADAGWISETNLAGEVIVDGVASFYPTKGITADHVAAMTRFDIYGSNSDGSKTMGVVGMATVSGACKNQRTSINEDNGLHCWATLAHEMAHNLAASHDGSSNACDSGTKFLMSPSSGSYTASNVQNSIKFSTCSAGYMKAYIDGMNSAGSNCLSSTSGTRFPNTCSDSTPLGRTWNLDMTCKETYGSNAIFFKSSTVSSNPSEICSNIYCKSSPSDSYASTSGGMRAPNGTPCGNKKSCNWLGQCVADENAPAADESCFFGDNDTQENCDYWKSILESYPEYCPSYKSYVRSTCCKTCANTC